MIIFKVFLQDESGATAIEYGLLATLIAVAMITGATQLGQGTARLYQGTGEALNAMEGAP